MLPEIDPVPVLLGSRLKVTVSPEVEVADNVIGETPYVTGEVGWVKVMVWEAWPTVKLCGLPVTAASSVVAVALAVSVQDPNPTKLTTPPDTVQTVGVVEAVDSVGLPTPV
jgi:hypothetical protein